MNYTVESTEIRKYLFECEDNFKQLLKTEEGAKVDPVHGKRQSKNSLNCPFKRRTQQCRIGSEDSSWN
jgi:hypothetical protein